MNSTYRIVWNALRQLWIAVPETAHAHRKAGRASSTVRTTTRRPGLAPRLATLAAATLAALGLLGAESALAQPENVPYLSPCVVNSSDSKISAMVNCTQQTASNKITITKEGTHYRIDLPTEATVTPINLTDIYDSPTDGFGNMPTEFVSTLLPLFILRGDITGQDFDVGAYRNNNSAGGATFNDHDTGTLDLQVMRLVINGNIDPIYTTVNGGTKVYRPLTMTQSTVLLNDNIIPTHQQSATSVYTENLNGQTVRYPAIRLLENNAIVIRGKVHGITTTNQLDGGNGIFAVSDNNYVEIASEVFGGDSGSGSGGSAVEFAGANETLVLRAGAKLKAGSGGTPFTVKMGDQNTLKLTAGLGTGSDKVDITGQVQGHNTTLILSGEANQSHTLNTTVFAEDQPLETAGIVTLKKMGDKASTWKVEGQLPYSITGIYVDSGILDLRDIQTDEYNDYTVTVGNNFESAVEHGISDALAYTTRSLEGSTLLLAGNVVMESLTVNRGALVDIDENTRITTNAGSGAGYVFQEGSTLRTNATTLGTSGDVGDQWKTAFLRSTVADRTLITTSDIVMNENWRQIKTWKVEGSATVKRPSADMPTITEVAANKQIAFANGLNLETFEVTDGKTLLNAQGITLLDGTSNLDWLKTHGTTPLKSTFAPASIGFATPDEEDPLPVLETNLTAGVDLDVVLAQLDSETLGHTALTTLRGFVGTTQAQLFKVWNVRGNSTATSYAAGTTKIATGATLTNSGDLAAAQTVDINGTLAFSGGIAGNITGAGTLRKIGANPIIMSNAKAFTGTFDVAAGLVNMQSVNWTALSAVHVEDGATLQLHATNLSGAALTVDAGGKLDVTIPTNTSSGGASGSGASDSGSSSSSPSPDSGTPNPVLENVVTQPMAARVRVVRSVSDSPSSTTEPEPPSYEGTEADRSYVANATINGTFVVHADSTDHFTQLWSTGDIVIGEGATLDIQPGSWTSSAVLKNVLKSDTSLTGTFSGNGYTNDRLHLSIVPSYRTADHAMDLKVVYTGTVTPPEGNCSDDHPCPPGSDGGNPNENNPNGGNPDGNNPNGNNPDGNNPNGNNPNGNNPNGNNPDGNNPNGNNPGDNTNPPGNTNRHTLETIAREYGKDAAVPMARVMDELITKNPATSIDLGLLALNDRARLAEAMVQAMPLLAGTGNRALMDAMREMTRPVAVDRCQAPTDKHVWAEALGDWSRRNSAGGAMGYDANHTGIAVGSDACIERLKNTRLGFTGAYTHTDADSRGTSADHNLKANSWMVGMYGNTPLNEAWDVDFNVNAGRSSVKGTRNLTLANRIAKSKTDATLVTAGAGLNWHLMVTDKVTVTPFVRADYSRVAMDGYTETGAKGLNLSVEKQTSDSFVTRVGVKTELAVTPAWSVSATAAVGADWVDGGHEVTASFAQFPGSTFTVENDRHGRAVADLVLGTSYAITPAVTFSANAITGVAKGTNHTAIDARVTWKF